MRDLPPIDLVLLTHAHFDHFHKPTLRRLPHPKIGIMPRGVGDLEYYRYDGGPIKGTAEELTRLMASVKVEDVFDAVAG